MSAPSAEAATHSRGVGAGVPLSRSHAYMTSPAVKKRTAASRNGGTSWTPTRIARKVDPHTK